MKIKCRKYEITKENGEIVENGNEHFFNYFILKIISLKVQNSKKTTRINKISGKKFV